MKVKMEKLQGSKSEPPSQQPPIQPPFQQPSSNLLCPKERKYAQTQLAENVTSLQQMQSFQRSMRGNTTVFDSQQGHRTSNEYK